MDQKKIAIGGLIGLLLLLCLGVGVLVITRGGSLAASVTGAGIGSVVKTLGASPVNSQGNGHPSTPGSANAAPNGSSNPGNGNTLPGANVNANPGSNANGAANVGDTSNANRCLNVTSGRAQASLCSNPSQMPTGNVNTGQ